MRVISMLVGIPESDQATIRDHFQGHARGRSRIIDAEHVSGAIFADYIDWRVEHPSDDIMTQLLNAEFEDENGESRRLTRDELLAYVNIVAAAGNETTRVLIGWMGKLLSEHPDQRRVARRGSVARYRTRSRRSSASSPTRCRTVATSRRTSSTTARWCRPGAAW